MYYPWYPNRSQDTTPSQPPRWRELVAAEPRLAALLARAQRVDGSDPHFCTNAVWYGYEGHEGIKPSLRRLVGWAADRVELRTEAAYDVAYQVVYGVLPPCRACACIRP